MATAGRALGVRTIPREQHSHVHLVRLALEPAEVPGHAVPCVWPRPTRFAVIRLTVDHPILNFSRQFTKWYIGRDAIALGCTHHIPLALSTSLGLPWLHHSIRDGQRQVRQCQAVVDRDNSAEATTLQTGTNWVVKTEQRRRRIAILDIACGAVKLATEPLWGGPVGVNRQLAFTELISLLDRLKKPGTAPLGQAHAILHHRQGGEVPLGQALGRLIYPQHFR